MASWIVAAAAVVAFSAGAFASETMAVLKFQQAGSGGPITVSAEEVSYRPQKGLTILTGGVVVEQGSLSLAADFVEVHGAGGRPSEVERIVAEGGLRVETGVSAIAADRGEWDVAGQRIELTGNVTMTTEGSTFTGLQFVHDLATGESSLKGRASGSVQLKN